MSRHIEIRGQTAISMRSFVKSHYQDLSRCNPYCLSNPSSNAFLVLLFLHRAHFAQAMMENPADPLAGPHGRSVTAAYQSACVILDDTRAQFEKQPMLCARIWRIWTHAFSAAVSELYVISVYWHDRILIGSGWHPGNSRPSDAAPARPIAAILRCMRRVQRGCKNKLASCTSYGMDFLHYICS
jgi:hypothetical protein